MLLKVDIKFSTSDQNRGLIKFSTSPLLADTSLGSPCSLKQIWLIFRFEECFLRNGGGLVASSWVWTDVRSSLSQSAVQNLKTSSRHLFNFPNLATCNCNSFCLHRCEKRNICFCEPGVIPGAVGCWKSFDIKSYACVGLCLVWKDD